MSRTRGFPGSIERRGKGLRLRLCVGGERHYLMLKTTDRRVAQQRAKVWQKELERQAERRDDGLPGPVSVSQLADEFERDALPKLSAGTATTYRCALRRVREFFAGPLDLPVDRVRRAHVKRFLDWRAARRLRKGNAAPIGGAVANRTLQKERTFLHTLFSFADECEYRDGNPVTKTKEPRTDARQPVILTDEEYGRLLLECADPALYLYAVVLGEAGLRDESEALWLRWEDVDLDGGDLAVVSGRADPDHPKRRSHRTKSGRSRYVPMTKRLADAFRAYREAHGGKGWLFAHPTAARKHLRGARIASMRKGLAAAARRAGIDAAWHPHDLRHRRVTTWLEAGGDVVKVKEAMGHADLRTTMGYAHLVRGQLRSLVDEPAPAPQG